MLLSCCVGPFSPTILLLFRAALFYWAAVLGRVTHHSFVESDSIQVMDRRYITFSDITGVFFIFIFFENIFYRNIFSISHFTVLYPSARQGGGKDLYVNFKKFYLHGSPWWEPAAPLAGGRLPVVGTTIRCVLDMDTNKNH